MVTIRHCALMVFAGLLVSGCGSARRSTNAVIPAGTDVHDVRHVRELTYDVTVAEPQAAWSPSGHVLLTRGIKGIMIGREGLGSQHYRTDDAFSPWNPQWMDDGTVLYGPEPRPTREDDGTVVVPAQGLYAAKFNGRALEPPATLTEQGYLGIPWNSKEVVMNIENQIIIVDQKGEEELFGEGFYPTPQRNGPGLTWQETPVFAPDWWTGKTGAGDLVVRWKAGQVDLIPGGVQARWTEDGGVVATVIRGPVPERGDWWQAGTDVVYLSGPGARPVTVMRDARDPDPHPDADIVAVAGNDGRVHLARRDGGSQRVIADVGSRPRWSADGSRLAVQEKHPDQQDAAVMRVYVLAVRSEREAAEATANAQP